MTAQAHGQSESNRRARFRLRTLLILITLACLVFTAGKLWRDYQQGARDRGFIAGLKLAIEVGPEYSSLGSQLRLASSKAVNDYEQGLLEGHTYISPSGFIRTNEQRKAQILSKLALDFDISRSLKAKATAAIRNMD